MNSQFYNVCCPCLSFAFHFFRPFSLLLLLLYTWKSINRIIFKWFSLSLFKYLLFFFFFYFSFFNMIICRHFVLLFTAIFYAFPVISQLFLSALTLPILFFPNLLSSKSLFSLSLSPLFFVLCWSLFVLLSLYQHQYQHHHNKTITTSNYYINTIHLYKKYIYIYVDVDV